MPTLADFWMIVGNLSVTSSGNQTDRFAPDSTPARLRRASIPRRFCDLRLHAPSMVHARWRWNPGQLSKRLQGVGEAAAAVARGWRGGAHIRDTTVFATAYSRFMESRSFAA
jgi:hypothetical protein